MDLGFWFQLCVQLAWGLQLVSFNHSWSPFAHLEQARGGWWCESVTAVCESPGGITVISITFFSPARL